MSRTPQMLKLADADVQRDSSNNRWLQSTQTGTYRSQLFPECILDDITDITYAASRYAMLRSIDTAQCYYVCNV